MEHDDIKLKIVDINDGEALIEAARPKGKALTEEQKRALIQAQKKKEEEKENRAFCISPRRNGKKCPEKSKEPLRFTGYSVAPGITEDGLYQIRARSQGLNIQVTHKDFTVCKELYIQALENALEGVETPKKPRPRMFRRVYVQMA